MSSIKLFLILVAFFATAHSVETASDEIVNELINAMESLQRGITDIKQDFSKLRQRLSTLHKKKRILRAKTSKPMKKWLPMKIDQVQDMEVETKEILEYHIGNSREQMNKQNSTIVLLEQQDQEIYENVAELEISALFMSFHEDVAQNSTAAQPNDIYAQPNDIYARDCSELLRSGEVWDGVYTIYANNTPIQVYCDMSGEGWTVFQKRFDGSENFHRTMAEYSRGFGDFNGEHWLGLNNVHLLTQTANWKLQVDVDTFQGEKAFSTFLNFKIGSAPGFALHFDYERGVPLEPEDGREKLAGGMSLFSRGQDFSTWDVDQDSSLNRHCSRDLQGAWWYTRCWYTNLNAYNYGPPRAEEEWRRDFTQINWVHDYWALKKTAMKMRLQDNSETNTAKRSSSFRRT